MYRWESFSSAALVQDGGGAMIYNLWTYKLSFDCFRSDGDRGSPKPDVDSRDLLEERVSTRGNAASPTGAHVADIYLANLNKCVSDYLQYIVICNFSF